MVRIILNVLLLAGLILPYSLQANEANSVPEIKQFTIIPPATPKDYILENSSHLGSFVKNFLPMGALAAGLRADDAAAVANLSKAMQARNFFIEVELAKAVQAELDSRGYKNTILTPIKRSERWPDWFEYEKMQFEGDLILHFAIAKVGVESPKGLSRFYPQIDINVAVARKGKKNKLIDESIHFGPNATENDREMSVTRKADDSFSDAKELFQNIPRLEAIYRAALPKLAKRMVDIVHDGLL